MNEPDIDVMWRAFADADARLKAPAGVRSAVMSAWDGMQHRRTRARTRLAHVCLAGAAATAAALLVPIGVAWRPAVTPEERKPIVEIFRAELPEIAPAAPVEAAPTTSQTAVRRGREVGARSATRTAGGQPDPVVRLMGYPALETEWLQIVRLRMPRAGLQVFGVALLEPDAPSLVDVDVLVGGDGLPRDILGIRPVLDVSDSQ